MCNQKLYPGKQRSERDRGHREQFHSSKILWQKKMKSIHACINRGMVSKSTRMLYFASEVLLSLIICRVFIFKGC